MWSFFAFLAIAIQLAPPLVGIGAGSITTSARRWLAVWCLLMTLQDVVMVRVAAHGSPNLWVTHVANPVLCAVALWTLSLWHEGRIGRLALRATIPALVVVSAVLSLTLDAGNTFSLYAEPFDALVLLLACVWTFVGRGLTERARLVRSDWFWVIGGLILYFGPLMAFQPVLSVLYDAGRQDLWSTAQSVRIASVLLAFSSIAGGMLCPPPLRTPSGRPSSPPSSRSPSSREAWP
jgi:hypothetical protein